MVPLPEADKAARHSATSGLVSVSEADRDRPSLLDEQHLLVGRQRPEVVGDEGFELVAGGADGVHGGDDHVAGVLGVVERVAVGVLFERRLESWSSATCSSSIVSDSSPSRLDLRLRHAGAGGLELGDRTGDLGLVPQGRRQDQAAGDLRG